MSPAGSFLSKEDPSMKDELLMKGFPPPAELQVTLANWRKPPFNKWAFQHVCEIIPSAAIPNDPENVRELPSAPQDFADFSFEDENGSRGLASFLRATDTDSLIVMRGGKIAYELYGSGMQRQTPHILMSVSKSVLGLTVGILVERGELELDSPVTRWIPEVAKTAYADATLRDLLDMRVGIFFDEDYLANAGPIIEYRKAQNWDPLAPGETPGDLRSFFASLVEADGAHKGRFHYVSPNTDLMGWVIERATGEHYADLVSELLWRPMGAAHGAYITVDRLGAPRCAGGFCATARDLARLGLLVAQGGRYAGKQIVPSSWIEDILTRGDPQAWDAGDFVKYFPRTSVHYRSMWYVLRGPAPMIFAVGVFGQNLFIDPKNQIVIAKFSSQALPMDEKRIMLTMRGVQAIRSYLLASQHA
jgi:CubicO group peptidase (beta-lactamase class C family)